MKTCRRCDEEKPKCEFDKSPMTGDGLAYYCKECVRMYMLLRKARGGATTREHENIFPDPANVNIYIRADTPCKKCGLNVSKNRDARVDTEMGSATFFYHLSCYDEATFGFVRHSTQKKIDKLTKDL